LHRLQRRLERFYHLEETPDVRGFVRESLEVGEREALLLRESEGSLEVALVVPGTAANENDDWLQLAEGVSHFVYVTNRARQELPSTQVDKFVLLVLEQQPFDRGDAFEVHSQLYERVRFLHAAGTELGDRYRTANHLAARFVRRLMSCGSAVTHATLRRFYRAGQAEKIRLVAA
jgi:hypothetical protein